MQESNEFVDYWDLAYVLTSDYNAFAALTLDVPLLSCEWVHEKLLNVFEPDDIELLSENDFGRGIIMGQLRVLHELEQLPEEN